MADSERTVTDEELRAKGERMAAARRAQLAAHTPALLPYTVALGPSLGAPWDYGPGISLGGKQFIGGGG